MSLWKEPSANLFRGSFAATPQSEPMAMMLCLVVSLLFIWGLAEVCKLVELAGVRVTELSWLGSHSLIVYLYHMLFAWIICVVTGFSFKYAEPVSGIVLAQSWALALASLTLCILRDLLGARVSKAWQERKAAKE